MKNEKLGASILFTFSLFSIPYSLSAAVPLRWTVETSRVQPAIFEVYHGETLALEATLQSYGKPLAIEGTPALYWQTNGMGSTYWIAPAAAESNRVSAVFLPAYDTGANTVQGFIGVSGSIYRAAFQLRLRPSPGATPNALPLPTPVIDFAKVRVLNPPWPDRSNFVSRTELTAATNAIRRVDGAARPLPRYLHALDFDDNYPEDAAWYYAQPQDYGECSAVRDGGFLCRNYDWKFDDAAEFVVKVGAGAGRFASVGVANVGTNLTEEIVTSGKWSRYYKCLPGRTVDGINENGVVCEVNVVDGAPPASTGGDIHPLGAVRWVLDNATSAEMAASNLAVRIAFPSGFSQNFHWMIADERETYIVANGNYYECSNRVALTNFPLKPTREPYGEGQERYDALMGGANITSQWWTLTYTPDGCRASDIQGLDTNLLFRAWAAKPKEAHRGETFGGKSWWQTVHTSVYDLTNRTLRVAVQEQDDWYTFAVPSSGGGLVEEVDPTVADWARKPNPAPVTDLTPATNYTDAATNALAALIPGGYAPDPTDPTFSNAVLAVNLGIDTNQVAALAELAGLPISESAGTVGGLLLLLVAAVLALKRGKADGNRTYFAAGDGAECTGVDEGEVIGGTVRAVGDERIVTWTGAGSIKFPGGVTSARVLVVGGGGGGGGAMATGGTSMSGGGGGGGQVIDTVVTVAAGTTYAVTIGAGGTGGNYTTVVGDPGDGASGGASSFGDLVAALGGAGGRKPASKLLSGAGGACGGGAHAGGGANGSAGGGGAGAGADGQLSGTGGNGGDGIVVDESWGLEHKVAAGGGGGYSGNYTTRGGVGGDFGGGHGASRNLEPTAGSYYGAGGGGADSYGMTAEGRWGYGASGASGVVIVRYTVPPQSPTGIAIGLGAQSKAAHAMQIGEGVNDQPMTVKFHDYLMLKADGTIPPERLGAVRAAVAQLDPSRSSIEDIVRALQSI